MIGSKIRLTYSVGLAHLKTSTQAFIAKRHESFEHVEGHVSVYLVLAFGPISATRSWSAKILLNGLTFFSLSLSADYSLRSIVLFRSLPM